VFSAEFFDLLFVNQEVCRPLRSPFPNLFRSRAGALLLSSNVLSSFVC
jgi:hypothetical protein